MKTSTLHYSVGALLYCPANNETIVNSLITQKFGSHFSLALCLEDTIADHHVKEAEDALIRSLKTLSKLSTKQNFYIPKIFIRVRNSRQIPELLERLGDARQLVTGFNIPKFCLEYADEYIDAVVQANKLYGQKIYMMPIFENAELINLQKRCQILYTLKEKLDAIEELVLNIRVGGNDLCHVFGFRRSACESIHDIKPISNIFADIITVFGTDYVISGPVWEYYTGDNWDKGLMRELSEDRLNGFVGKTVIHPNQIALVNAAYQVSSKDLADARSILNWNPQTGSLVSGSISGERMNERKTHYHWAEKILMLAEVYGVRE